MNPIEGNSKILANAEDQLDQNLYKESMKSIFQAKKMAETTSSENFKAYTCVLLANFYRGLELNDKAYENIELAMNHLSLINDSKDKNYIESRFLLEKGLLNFAVSKQEEGKINLWKSRTKLQQIGNPKLASKSLQFINSKLGDYYLSQNEMDSARHYFGENLKLSKQFPSLLNLDLRTKHDLSKYYLQKKQPDSALFYISGFDKVLPMVKDVVLKKEVYKNLAQVHYAVNDLENYKSFNEQYLKLNDSIYELNKEAMVLLANEADNAEVENTGTNRSLWILVVLGVAIVGLAFTYAYHRKVKKEYAQFQKIMKDLNEKENLRVTEV